MKVTVRKEKEELVLTNPSEDIMQVIYCRARKEYDANYLETLGRVNNFLQSSSYGKKVFKSKPIEITVEKTKEVSKDNLPKRDLC